MPVKRYIDWAHRNFARRADRRADARDDHRARGHAGRLQQGRHPVRARRRAAAVPAPPLPVRRADGDVRCTRPSFAIGLEPGRQRPVVPFFCALGAMATFGASEERRIAYAGIPIALRDGRVRHARVPTTASARSRGSPASSSRAWFVGFFLSSRSRQTDELRERAERLELRARGQGARRRRRGARADRARAARHRRPLGERDDGAGLRRAAAAARGPGARARGAADRRGDRPRRARRDAPARRRAAPAGGRAGARPAAEPRVRREARRADARGGAADTSCCSRGADRRCRRASTSPRTASSRRA